MQILKRSRCVFCAFFAVLLLPAIAQAQERTPSRSFVALQRDLAFLQGDKIEVVSRSGTTIEGRLEELSADTLSLVADGTRRQLPESSVQRIIRERPDPIHNGVFIGIGVGLLAAIGAGQACGGDEYCAAYAAAILWPGLAITGGVIDAFHHGYDTVYEAPNQARNQRFTISPIVSGQQPGIRFAFSF